MENTFVEPEKIHSLKTDFIKVIRGCVLSMLDNQAKSLGQHKCSRSEFIRWRLFSLCIWTFTCSRLYVSRHKASFFFFSNNWLTPDVFWFGISTNVSCTNTTPQPNQQRNLIYSYATSQLLFSVNQ